MVGTVKLYICKHKLFTLLHSEKRFTDLKCPGRRSAIPNTGASFFYELPYMPKL